MKFFAFACLGLLLTAATTQQAFAWRGSGPRGGAAARGPMGGAAVRGPGGNYAVRGPGGNRYYPAFAG